MKYILGIMVVLALIVCFVLVDGKYNREGLGWTYALWGVVGLLLAAILIIKKKKK